MSSIMKGLVTEKKKKPKPTSPEKWSRAKAKARSKFDVYPSAYANAYASKEYKKMGGGWRMGESIVDLDENMLSTYADMFDLDEDMAEGVRDLGYDAQSLIMKLRRDVEEKRLQPTPQAVLAAARELAGDMEFAPQLLVKQVLGQGVAEAQGDTLHDPEYALPEARRITKAIKYDDTVGEIITQIQMLAERTEGIDSKTLEYSIDGVLAAKNALESAVYGLEEAFEDAARDAQYKRDEVDEGNYHDNRTGFKRGPRDDERHDLDVQQPSKQVWGLKINGKVWSKDGKDVTFASKEQALKARQSLLAKRPELEVGLVTKMSEDYTGMFAAEKTPETNPYGGSKDRQFRGAISETPTDNPTGSSGEGGWRTYRAKPAGQIDEEEQLDELKCWSGYTRVKGVPAGAPGSCKKKTKESSIMKGISRESK